MRIIRETRHYFNGKEGDTTAVIEPHSDCPDYAECAFEDRLELTFHNGQWYVGENSTPIDTSKESRKV